MTSRLPMARTDPSNRADLAPAKRVGLLAAMLLGVTVLALPVFAVDDVLFTTQYVPTSADPREVDVGDWSGDGIPDVAVLIHNDGVDLFRGLGNGALVPAGTLLAGVRLAHPVLADIDGDEVTDLIVVDDLADQVLVLLADGVGGFGPAVPVAGVAVTEQIALGDLDQDGELDLAAIEDADIHILLGDGTGAFGAPATFQASPSGLRELALGDMDGDGHLDVVGLTVFSAGPPTFAAVHLLQGFGDGTLGPYASFTTEPLPTGLALADLNADGSLDVVTSHNYTCFCKVEPPRPGLVVLLGNGDLTLDPPMADLLTVDALDLEVIDFTGDGTPDVLLADKDTGEIRVMQGAGDGTFTEADRLPAIYLPYDVVAQDMDNDGHLDLIVPGGVDDALVVLPGNGSGGVQGLGLFESGGFAVELLAASLDGDGWPDAVVRNAGFSIFGAQEGLDVQVLLSSGPGTFGPPSLLAEGNNPEGLAAGDLDDDGTTDVLIARIADLAVFLGAGDGTLSPAPLTLLPGADARAVAVGDLDGDGTTDAVTADAAQDRLSILLGLGDGTFAAPTHVPVGSNPQDVALADFDLDGALDVVSADRGSGELSVILAAGGASTVSVPGTPDHLEVADMDVDGVPDLISTSGPSSSLLSVLLGDGAGGFGAALSTASGTADDFAVGDVDLDGLPDVVVGDVLTRTGVLWGAGDGGLVEPATQLANSPGASGLVLVDVDADGDLDLMAACLGGLSASPRVTVTTNAAADTWCDLGLGLGGSAGLPRLVGEGTLAAGDPVTLTADQLLPASTAFLVVGVGNLSLPFKGGTLVPTPDVVLALPTLAGELSVSAPWPPGVPPGFTKHVQVWVDDPAGPFGFAASNGVAGTTP